jgi:hypothetical protein
MIWALPIIVAVALIASWFFFNKRKTTDNSTQSNSSANKEYEFVSDEIEVDKDFQQNFWDDDGNEYFEREVINYIPRRTYIYGILESKYYGEEHPESLLFSSRQDFYKISLYDTKLIVATCSKCRLFHNNTACNGIHKEAEGRFDLGPDTITSKEWLPSEINCDMSGPFGRNFQVKLLEPEINDIEINPLLHQKEGNEVFGSLKAKVTGFILDFTEERFIEKIYINSSEDSDPPEGKTKGPNEKETEQEKVLYETLTPTGNTEKQGNYVRREFFMSDYKTRYWTDWKYEPPTSTNGINSGCLGAIPGIILLLIAGILLFIYLPRILFFLPLFAVPYLLSLIPSRAWNWILGLIGIILFGLVAYNIYNAGERSSRRVSHPTKTDSPEEKKVQVIDGNGSKRNYTDNSWQKNIYDTTQDQKDSVVCIHRIWQDANGVEYQGDYCLNINDVADCANFRSNLSIPNNPSNPYQALYAELAHHDNLYLSGIYEMLEKITADSKLNYNSRANMIVSFAQDFEYALVLEGSCNPQEYNDPFIVDYLSKQNGPCDDKIRYGVYSPIEFLYFREGDCDTRTLLLYTLLDHFGYDVILLTSSYYKHSIIGVDIPSSGTEVEWQNGHYTLWETTVSSLPSGIIADDMLDFNHWQVALSNKHQ